MRRPLLTAAVAMLAIGPAHAAKPEAPVRTTDDAIFVRTERYPRPPYSGATYYLYERAGTPVCTKLAVCNKFDACETTYFAGRYLPRKTSEPASRTAGRLRCRSRATSSAGTSAW